MSNRNAILLIVLLSVFGFSCRQTKKRSEQKADTLSTGITQNELSRFFKQWIDEFSISGPVETRNYYFVFWKTDSDDTVFVFTYSPIYPFPPHVEMLKYTGYLKIDSMYVSIYDEMSVGIGLYNNNLHTEPVPKDSIHTTKDDRYFSIIGRLKDNKIKEITQKDLSIEDMNKYHYGR